MKTDQLQSCYSERPLTTCK